MAVRVAQVGVAFDVTGLDVQAMRFYESAFDLCCVSRGDPYSVSNLLRSSAVGFLQTDPKMAEKLFLRSILFVGRSKVPKSPLTRQLLWDLLSIYEATSNNSRERIHTRFRELQNDDELGI
jgi:predicted GTPase